MLRNNEGINVIVLKTIIGITEVLLHHKLKQWKKCNTREINAGIGYLRWGERPKTD